MASEWLSRAILQAPLPRAPVQVAGVGRLFQYQGGGPAVCGVFLADTRGIPPNLDDRLVTRRPRFGLFTAVVRGGYGPRLSSRRSVGEMG